MSISSHPVLDLSDQYYKVLNAEECHNGFQYIEGLNVLRKPFNDDPKASCVPGGLYFANANNISKFDGYGPHVRQVTFPLEDPNFKVVADCADKFRANMIILGPRLSVKERLRLGCLTGIRNDEELADEDILEYLTHQPFYDWMLFDQKRVQWRHLVSDEFLQKKIAIVYIIC